MELREIVHDLEYGNPQEEAVAKDRFASWEFSDDEYPVLLELIEQPERRLSFWALDRLIWKLPHLITANADDLVPKLYRLIELPAPPIIDRASWAMCIIGDPASKYMLERYPEASAETQCKTLMIFRRLAGASPTYRQKAIALLIRELQNPQSQIRYCAMCSLMDMSPIRQQLGHFVPGVDFDPILSAVYPIAKAFVDSGQNTEDHFAFRYLKLLQDAGFGPS